MLRSLIHSAQLTCKTGTKQECAVAWDAVEEVSAATARKRKRRETVRFTHKSERLESIGRNMIAQDRKMKKQKEDLIFLWKYYKYVDK